MDSLEKSGFFSQHFIFLIHPHFCMQSSFLLYCCIIFHCVTTPQSIYPIYSSWISKLFPVGTVMKCCYNQVCTFLTFLSLQIHTFFEYLEMELINNRADLQSLQQIMPASVNGFTSTNSTGDFSYSTYSSARGYNTSFLFF